MAAKETGNDEDGNADAAPTSKSTGGILRK
jgi:hypothetical protein